MNQQFKNTKIGEIPMDWEADSIEQISNLITDYVASGSFATLKENVSVHNYKEYALYVRLVDIRKGLGHKGQKYVDKETFFYLKKSNLEEGDILLANIGAAVGETFIMPQIKEKATIAPNMILIRINTNKCDNNYIHQHLSSEYGQKEITKIISGSGHPKINKGDLKKLQIPLPPLPEQKKIAEILTTWDNAINKTTALIKAKEVLKKGLMQGLLLGKVQVRNGQKEEFKKTKLGVIPKHWTLKNAGDIFKSISIKNNENEELLAATQAKGIIPKRLLETNYTMPSGSTNGYKLLQDGNFVISLRSFQGGIEYSEYQGIISPAYTILTNKIPIDKTFFRYFFKSTEFIGRLSVAVIGIRDGKQISFQDFSAMTFRFPPLEEQTKIANILETADKEIDLLKKELAKIEEQKRGLMQVLLTGKVRVKV